MILNANNEKRKLIIYINASFKIDTEHFGIYTDFSISNSVRMFSFIEKSISILLVYIRMHANELFKIKSTNFLHEIIKMCDGFLLKL